LDYAKLESGVFEVEIGPTNLEQTLRSVIRSMEPKVAQKNVRISAHYGSTLPECIETDPRRLQQVLYNLLGNAAKFSKPGGVIDVHISLEEAGSQCDGDRVRFSVKDYGKGIDERDFETIFRPFNRASQETQAVYGGTGLGLSISSKLVKRLGGTISVDSKVGEYAEFTVELPVGGSILKQKKIQPLPVLPAISKEHHDGPPVDVIQCPSPSMTGLFAPINDRTEQEGSLEPQSKKLKSSHRSMFGLVSTAGSNVSMSTTVPSFNTVQPSLPATKEGGSVSPRDTTWQPPKSPPRKRLRVLYAEDNIVNQKVFSRILAKLGITDLDIVDNGLEAVEFSATKVYDIIFMDMQMPIMDGLEATRLIKERGGDGDITAPKIVFCTAHAMDDFRWQAEQAGGDGFVSKPFNMKMIDSILQEYE
jgi:CheY-like chemotaxis protein